MKGRKLNPLVLPAFHCPPACQRVPCGLTPISELRVRAAEKDRQPISYESSLFFGAHCLHPKDALLEDSNNHFPKESMGLGGT